MSEKHLCRLFLEHLMIRECGLYTLLGTKPMTQFDKTQGFPDALEEQEKRYHEFLELLEEDKVYNDRPSFEEYVAQEIEDIHLDCRKLWKFWEGYQKDLLGEKYIILGSLDSDEEDGLFINIPSTVYVLKKHQAIFEKETGVTFDPNIILEEITDRKSPFWSKVFRSSYLYGILMGYGVRNSLIWTWCSRQAKTATIKMGSCGHNSSKEIGRNLFSNQLKASDLLLPTYVNYSIYDETLEMYRYERESIIKYFEKKEFIPAVLEILKTPQGE